jgi:hypothetical protein
MNNDWTQLYRKQADEDGYVPFNADRRAGQNQYASRYVDGRLGCENLGEGLRWKLDETHGASDYHSIKIHINDLEEFHRHYAENKKHIGFC